jgi:L-ribulokinase
MGTSTCHLVNAAAAASVPGACGVVEDGIVAGLWGYEAGQSGTGDALAWFVDSAVPAAYAERARADGVSVHDLLSRLADELEVGESGLLALDWFNGNRSVLVDAELSGAIVGLTLATRPEHVYRALVEATAFGTRVIVEAYRAAGVPVTDVVVAGGLSRNPMLRRIYADVLGLPLSVVDSAHEAALGAAVAAAVAAGAFPDVPTAAGALTRIRPDGYRPDPQRTARYDELYAHYLALHDHFGRHTDVLRALRGLRRDAIHRRTGA